MTSYASAMIDPEWARMQQAARHAPPGLLRRAQHGDPAALYAWIEEHMRPGVDRGHWDANGSEVCE